MWKTFVAIMGIIGNYAFLNAQEIQIDYPTPFTLIQRDTPKSGTIKISGFIKSEKIPAGQKQKMVEARFNGGKWQVVNKNPSGNVVEGTITGDVGQGALEVRIEGAAKQISKVENVGIGDLFLITGQSNADGRGAEMVKMNPDNPFIGVKYNCGKWSKGEDPSSNEDTAASPWPIVLNRIIPDQKIPVGFITAAGGSTVVKQWRRAEGATLADAWVPGGMYARALETAKTATGGTMKIKAVLYHQGENDITHWNKLSLMGDYKEYKENLNAAVSDFWNDFKVPVLVGQITNLGDDRKKIDNVRRVQQEIWADNPHAMQGAVTYDIFPTDGVHYKTAENMKAYADRWADAILNKLYDRKEMAYPSLVKLQLKGEKQILLIFDQPMEIARWNGQKGENAEGFSFTNGSNEPVNARVVSTVIKEKEVLIELDQPISADWKINYGSGADGQGGTTLRSKVNGLPVPMLFECKLEKEGRK